MRYGRVPTALTLPMAFLLAGGLAGCSGGSSAAGATGPPGPPEKTTINVAAFEAIDSAGLFIAQMDGLFAKEGLTVRIHLADSTQTEVNDQLNGADDVSLGDYVTYIDNAVMGSRQLLITGESSFLQPNVLTLLVKGNSSIGTIGELRGKTVSVNAADDIGTLLIDSLMIEHGVPLAEFTFNDNVPFPDVATALGSSSVAASFVPEPFVSLDEAGAGAEELADLDQGATQNFPIQGVAVTRQFAQKYPNTLKAFMDALNQGQEIADTSRPAVEKALEKFLDLTPEFASVVSLPTYPTSVNPIRLQRVVDAMVRFGLLPRSDGGFKITSMIWDG